MSERKPTPDILGGLLDGNNAVKPEYHKDVNTEINKDSQTEKQKTVKEEKGKTVKTVKRKDVDTAKQQAVIAETGGKTKVTFYVADGALNKLDEMWLALRQAVPAKQRGAVSKSGIIEAAIMIVARELAEQGSASAIVCSINGEDDASRTD